MITHCGILQALHEEEVVHFDLKCDNILLDTKPDITDQEFYQPTTSRLPCTVVLADIGESCDFKLSDCKFSTRCRPVVCVAATSSPCMDSLVCLTTFVKTSHIRCKKVIILVYTGLHFCHGRLWLWCHMT